VEPGDGTVGVFGGHTTFADPRRFWDFRSLGRGNVNFERIIAALNDIAYAARSASNGKTPAWTANTAPPKAPPSSANSISSPVQSPSTVSSIANPLFNAEIAEKARRPDCSPRLLCDLCVKKQSVTAPEML
jgi:hypothetical protein